MKPKDVTRKQYVFGGRDKVKSGGRFAYVLAVDFIGMVFVTSHKGTFVATDAMKKNMARSKNPRVRKAVNGSE